MSARTVPGFWRKVGRAVLRRCPWCGGKGAWFTGWFARQDTCRTCGLRWDRHQDGFEMGAMMIAVFVTGGAGMAVVIGGIIATYPDIAVFPLLVAAGLTVLVVAVVSYPFTYTLWSAVDLSVHPPEPHELEEAARTLAARGSGGVPLDTSGSAGA